MQSTDAAQQAARIDQELVLALETGDLSALRILGNGEFSVVLAWPSDAPETVAKPVGPFRAEEFESYASLIAEYQETLQAAGINTVNTEMSSAQREDNSVMGYMFQPMLEPDRLAENALTRRTPSTEDPILTAILGALMTCGPQFSIDPPVSNWYWNGDQAELLDLGWPLLFRGDGSCRLDLAPFMRSLPTPIRSPFLAGFNQALSRMRQPRNLAIEFVARLRYFGLGDWEQVALQAANDRLRSAEAITMQEADAMRASDRRDLKRFKRLQHLQRWWQRRIKRQRYEFFLGDSTY